MSYIVQEITYTTKYLKGKGGLKVITTKNYGTVNMTIKVEPELKESLKILAAKKGMDLSKLTRAVLTNYVQPNTYSL